MILSLWVFQILFSFAPAQAAVRTELVDYEQGGVQFQGFLAYDDALKGPRPGVAVFHEWWGRGPYAHRRAEQLAKLGYVAFAPDMYGKGVYAKTHEEAGRLSGALRGDRSLMRARRPEVVGGLAGFFPGNIQIRCP